jgi:signal transduction histidine kinase
LKKICEAGLAASMADPLQNFMSFLASQSQPDRKSSRDSVSQERGATTFVLQDRKQALQSYLLVPLLSHPEAPDPQAWGLLVACQGSTQGSTQRQWQPHEARFLNELAGQLAIAMQQAEQLTQAIEALKTEKQIHTTQSHFVSAVSAAYRSPLTVILTAASTLKAHANQLPESKCQQFLQMIEDKARQMAQLIDDLLAIEQLKFAKTTYAPVPFELLQCVADLVEEQRQSIGKQHDLTFKITGNTRGFWGNQKLLRQILANLLSNAIKYSPEESQVEVHLIGDASHITVQVTDQGMGIPLEDQSNLFESFSRGSNVGVIPGTGLGLAIVKECIELHKGKIIIESQEGKGTQVTVRLPKR